MRGGDDLQHYFNTEIASSHGVIAAIVSQNLWYWVRQNERMEKNYYNGKHWVYETVREMSEVLNYLTQNQIRKAIDDLVNEGILIKGNFNKMRYDRTLWYSFTDRGYAIFHKHEMEIEKNETRRRRKNEPYQ